MTQIKIPGTFSRARFCPYCFKNQFPYDNSERIKHHQLHFIVKPSSTEESLYAIRQQTKPAVVGITPHLFAIKEIIGKERPRSFIVECSCCIDGCGIRISREDYLVSPLNFIKGTTMSLNEKELIALYMYKDSRYMLDFKEPQDVVFEKPKEKPIIILPPGLMDDYSQS